ncbi:MAG: glycosyltransferase family 4 protein [Oscillospiraceae bacterium]|nr:glycosyltransferase family 4 protein [Oscillospiraceae bacterium]
MEKLLLFNMSSTIGGAGISFLQFLENIDRTEYELVVYNNANHPDIADIIESMGIRVIRALDSPVVFSHFSGADGFALSPIKLLNYLRILRDRSKISRVLDEEKPDVVIVNSMTLFWIGQLAHRRGIRAICLHREVYPNGLFGLRTRLIKYCLDRWFSDIAFISRHEQIETAASHARTCVIFDKVDLDKYQRLDRITVREELGLPSNAYLVLYIGGVVKLKGAHTIVDAMNYIDNSDIKLVFLQCSEQLKKKTLKDYMSLRAIVKLLLGLDYDAKVGRYYAKCHNKQSIIFRPGTAAIQDYFAACNVIVFPSFAPHQARPVYEAGAARIPVIISDFPHTAEFVTDGVMGFTFKPKDAKALMERIIYVYENQGTDKLRQVLENNYTNTVRYHNTATLREEIKSLLNETDAIRSCGKARFKE